MMGKGAIIVVIGFGLVYGIISLRMSKLQNRAVTNMSYYHDITNSHTIASAGANAALSMLYQTPTLRGALSSQTFSSGAYKGGSFTSRMDSLTPEKLRIRSVSNYRGYNDTVEVYFSTIKQNSFSMFAWMTNNENGVYWITGDTVWGRVHSNGTINVSGRPTFMEKVTTGANFSPKVGQTSGGNTNNAIFKKGYETGVAKITFPNDLSDLINAATTGGKKYTTNIWVTLAGGTSASGDGKAYIRNSLAGPIVDSISLSASGFNGALYSTGTVSVKGVVDGRLTIGSGTSVVVLDDILYETNPLVDPTSNDMLGLVAEGDIVVADNAANNANVEINATIFSRTGSFTAQNYGTRPVSGTLKLTGGIIQDNRGAVGTFSGSSIASGFSKRYRFDTRLADPAVRPPFFPGFYTATLAISNWWESVRIPDGNQF